MSQPTPEFSRILDIKQIGNAIKEFKLIAKPIERKALIDRLGIVALDMFEVIYTVEQIPNDSFKVQAEITAQLTQSCIQTGAPVKETVNESFGLLLRPANPKVGVPKENEIDLSALSQEAEEEIELPPNGKVDLGEVFVQYLALEMDPYPKSDNAQDPIDAPAETQKQNPFEILKKLK